MEQREARARALSFSVESLIARDRSASERENSRVSPQQHTEEVRQQRVHADLRSESPKPQEEDSHT
ncbi:homeobox protein MSX-2-like, partial [Clarias magur]